LLAEKHPSTHFKKTTCARTFLGELAQMYVELSGFFFAAPRSGTQWQGRQKHRTFSEKQFFLRKNGADFFVFFFALFARAMCGAGKGVLGDFLRLQRKTSPIFSEFPPLFLSVPKVLGP
jgi:hypothetical protein